MTVITNPTGIYYMPVRSLEGKPCIMKLHATKIDVWNGFPSSVLTKDPELDNEFIYILKATPLQIVDVMTGEQYSSAVSGWFCNARTPFHSRYEKLFYFHFTLQPEKSCGHVTYTVSKEIDINILNPERAIMDVRCDSGQYPFVSSSPIAYRSEEAARRLIREDLERLDIREKFLIEAELQAKLEYERSLCKKMETLYLKCMDSFKQIYDCFCRKKKGQYTDLNTLDDVATVKKNK